MHWSRTLLVALAAVALVLTACDAENPPADPANPATSGGADAAADPAAASAPPPADTGAAQGITVVGVGRVSAVPDAARVEVGVEVEGDDVADAYDAAAVALDDMVAALRDAGVGDDDLQTTSLSVRSRRPPPDTIPEAEIPGPETTTYLVRSSVEATLRDLDTAGEIIADVLAAGGDAARLDGFALVVEDDLAPLEEARSRAVADAERRAQQLADAAGANLGPLQGLRTVGGGGPDPAVEVAADAAGAVPIEPGTAELTVRVVATWSLG
jgi:hypothetical protein